MKFSINSSTLLKTLNKVGIAISSNPVLPILENFLFDVSNGTLKVSATDLETVLISRCEIIGNDKGGICVPAKILIDTLKETVNKPITFEANEKNGITLTTSNGRYKMPGESANDFPKVPNVDGEKITFESVDILKGIKQTNFAQSNDELRPAMTGTYFDFTESGLQMVATDAHKLSSYKITCTQKADFDSCIVSKKATAALKYLLTNEGQIDIQANKSNIKFEFDGIILISRLIDAKYPDYNAVIPVDNPNIATFNRSSLTGVLKRIALFANKTTNQVIFSINGDCNISAQDLDFSNEGKEVLDFDYDGGILEIGFNGKFLIESLNVLESETVNLEMSTSTRAGIIKPEGQDNSFLLVMPVMVG